MATGRINDALADKEMLPSEHLVDGAYLSSDVLVESRQQYKVEMIGPMRLEKSWQAQDLDAFDLSKFEIDWDAQTATCPMGQESYKWSSGKGPRGKPTIQINFNKRVCAACEARPRCTRSKNSPRGLTLHPRPQHEALQEARERHKIKAFKEKYKKRAGVEGTLSQAAFALGMRRTLSWKGENAPAAPGDGGRNQLQASPGVASRGATSQNVPLAVCSPGADHLNSPTASIPKVPLVREHNSPSQLCTNQSAVTGHPY